MGIGYDGAMLQHFHSTTKYRGCGMRRCAWWLQLGAAVIAVLAVTG